MLLTRTKLFETVLAMTTLERNRVPDFILSPFFYVKGDKTLEFYEILRTEVEKYERGEPNAQTEEELYSLLSKRAWNQKTFDSMESRLLTIIKKAIVYQYSGIDNLKQDVSEEEELNIEINQLLLLAQFYRERKLQQQFDSTINRLKVLQNTFPPIQGHYYTRFLITQEEYEYLHLNRSSGRKEKRIETLENLELSYIANKLSLLLQFDPPVKEEIEKELAHLEQFADKTNPLFSRIINLYSNAFTLIWHKEGEEETILHDFLKTLDEESILLPIAQRKDLYTIARNFCVIKYKNGKSQYLNTLFEIIKKNLKSGFFYHKDGAESEGIMFGSVQNIVSNALKLNESDWALKFLEEHRTKIIAPNSSEQKRFYNFNLACCHFQRKEYDTALQLLNIDFDDDRYRLIARALEIKLYFEKPNKKDKEVEFLDNRIGAFETYLSRNDMPELDKVGYRNFIKIIKKMLKLKIVTPRNLEDKDSIAEREWLVEKSDEVNLIIRQKRYSPV